jgi:hypothetical protein
VKHSILRSFETLIKGLDPAPEEPEPPPPKPPKAPKRPKPSVVVEKGVFLGRAWRRYADGGVDGETVRGMEAFRDLESFQSFVEGSPLLRTERSGADLEEAPTEPVLPSETTQGDAAAAEHAPDTPVHGAAPADRGQPVGTHRDTRLARELVIGGALGLVACVMWWLRFYVLDDVHAELLRRGLGESVIHSANLSVGHSLSCFFLNSDACVAVKNWGRFVGHLAYEPLFAWASIGAVALGLLLIHVQGKAQDRPDARQPPA